MTKITMSKNITIIGLIVFSLLLGFNIRYCVGHKNKPNVITKIVEVPQNDVESIIALIRTDDSLYWNNKLKPSTKNWSRKQVEEKYKEIPKISYLPLTSGSMNAEFDTCKQTLIHCDNERMVLDSNLKSAEKLITKKNIAIDTLAKVAVFNRKAASTNGILAQDYKDKADKNERKFKIARGVAVIVTTAFITLLSITL